MLITVNSFWMYHTYSLILMDQELQNSNWDPFTSLGIQMPNTFQGGFNTPEVKKAYRKLARIYHPDKHSSLAESEQVSAKKKWIEIVKSYETLTNPKKW